jgi:NADH-quinone oxidoreductase subunit F
MEKPLTKHIIPGSSPLTLKEYLKAGGYGSTRKALREMIPAEVTSLVKASNLLGRGGAGFPTGVKWSLVPMDVTSLKPKYLVCNADEMEPGTFKDRYLLEGNPHQLIAGMIISLQYRLKSLFFFAGHTRKLKLSFEKAIDEAYEAGYLGITFRFWLSILMFMSIQVQADTSAEKKQHCLIRLNGKGLHFGRNLHSCCQRLVCRPTVVNNAETLSWINI